MNNSCLKWKIRDCALPSKSQVLDGSRVTIIVGNHVYRKSPSSVFIHDIDRNTTIEIGTLPAVATRQASSIIEDRIYSIGGCNNGRMTNVSRMMLKENQLRNSDYCRAKWEEFSFIDRPRQHLVSGAVREETYVSGGADDHLFEQGMYSSVCVFNTEEFDSDDDYWQYEDNGDFYDASVSNPFGDISHGFFPIIPISLDNFAAVSVGRWIFVLSGVEFVECDWISPTNTCYVCDTESRTWYKSPAELQRLHSEGSAILLKDGRIVMIGEGHVNWMEDKKGDEQRECSVEFIHYIGLLPAEHRQQTLRESDGKGRLPIHSAAEYGLRWEDGMKYLLESYPESLQQKSSNGDGDFPIVLAASGSEIDLSTVYEMFRAMLERNLVPLKQYPSGYHKKKYKSTNDKGESYNRKSQR